MALQPAGTGNQPHAFGLRGPQLQHIASVLVTLCVVLAGNIAQAARVHGRTGNLLASTSTLTVSTNLPQGVLGVAYSGSIIATGGVSPYKFSVVDGSLQSGLYLNGTTGAVTGKPTAANTKYFWVAVTDAQGATAKLQAHIVIVSAATTNIIVAVSPTSATVGSGKTQQFIATVQGTTNTAVTWSASAGSISSGGLFTAPTVTTGTSVTVTATSAANSTKKASATVSVTASTPISVTVSPTSSTLTSGNTQQFAATVQGTSNTTVTWSATAGSISSAGMFTAPAVTSNTAVTVTATSAADTTKKSSASVAVSPTQSALAITTSGVPSAQSGVAYSYPIAGSGGTLPYQWKIASGSLPQGFTFSSAGQLSGTTTQSGTFSFTVQVTDAGNTSTSKVFSLPVIVPPPSTGGSFDGPAELPRVYMQTAMANTPAPGTTIQVNAGGNFQTALNSASCGDTIELAAGATFSGVVTLPAKSCDDLHWIIVRTSAPDSSLPAEGSRMTPCYGGVSSLPGRPSFNCSTPKNVLAKVIYSQIAGSGPFKLSAGANHYRFVGLEIARAAGTGFIGPLISVSSGTVNHIVLDRVWLHGSPQDDTQTGMNFGGMTYAAVIDSYLDDFHCTSVTGSCTDAHALSGGNSSSSDGIFKITGNFLEASTESILFGGGGATTTPADIEIRQNHFFKPLTWKLGQPGFVGGSSGNPFMVKNHLELKNAKRVLIEGNIFENTWGGFSQNGYSILLTPKNQASGTTNICPICQVTDVTIRFNSISHAGAGISMADVPSDNGGIATAGERYSIHDDVLDDIKSSFYNGSGTLFQVMNGWPTNVLNSISINHVTGFSDPGSRIIGLGNATTNPQMYGFYLKNSIIGQALYPIWSTGGTTNCAYFDVPITSLTACFASWGFSYNAIIGTSSVNYPPSKWPAANYFPSSPSTVQFLNYNNGNGGDYHLLSSSPYKNAASDGKDMGADIDAIQSATAGVY
jgi:hypothetical protein